MLLNATAAFRLLRLLPSSSKHLERGLQVCSSWRLDDSIWLFFLMLQITGKAVMLDEIINYVQSLQRQVEVRFRDLISLLLNTLRFALEHCGQYCSPGNRNALEDNTSSIILLEQDSLLDRSVERNNPLAWFRVFCAVFVHETGIREPPICLRRRSFSR
jgi:hypothetical protein